MKLSKKQALDLIDMRFEERAYQNYAFGNKWPFGQYKGEDINRLPIGYVVWHLTNNDELSSSHLKFFKQWIENMSSWEYNTWTPPKQEHLPEGYYIGYYNGTSKTEGYYNGL